MAHAWERANRQALTRTGPLWVALGDSMTQGIGTAGIGAGWVGQASRRLATAYRIVNLSRSGATVADVLAAQLPALRALGEQPELVTLLIGSNDLMGRERTELPGRFAELLDRLPRGTVVANLPNPTRTATAVNALLARAAASGTIVVADLTTSRPPSWRGRLAEDHFHPNAAGYGSLADAFVEAIANAPTEPDPLGATLEAKPPGKSPITQVDGPH